MEKCYKIVVNEDDETGVNFNSFVDVPAHLKGFIAFGKAERYQFNDEKRIVTGVFISANTLIPRNDQYHGRHNVLFDPETIEIINRKAAKFKYWDNINKMHDQNQVVRQAYLIERYIASNSDPKKPNIPEAFAGQKLEDGTLFGSYYIEDDVLWQEVKSGKFQGFSVEGFFDKVEIKHKTNMSKNQKSIWDLFKKAPKGKDKFAEATTADDKVISWEGDLSEGTAVFVELEGEKVPAPTGEHQLTLEDGSVKVITVDENGLVLTVTEVTADEDMESIKEEVADAMRSMMQEVNDRFEAIETESTKIKAENETFKAQIESFKTSGKFGADPKKVDSDEKKLTITEMVKNAKG